MYKAMDKYIKENLNKCKYVYRIYKEDNNFHIEKYPIVYINSKRVYFKNGRKDDLSCLSLTDTFTNIKTSFNDAVKYLNTKVTYYYPINVYFIEVDKLEKFDLSLIKQELKRASKEEIIKDQELKTERKKKEYELELRKLEDLLRDDKGDNKYVN